MYYYGRTLSPLFSAGFIMFRIIVLCLLLSAASVQAQEEFAPVPESPDIPPQVESGEPLEPDVTIIRRGEDIIEEYRINNRLYMVRIKPRIGPAYYLLDT